jgi:hypothetical protein
MSTRKALTMVSGLILGLAMLLPVGARADEYNEATQMTFNVPIQVPGNRVLPAGTYWFKLFDSAANRQIVQIYNADRSQVLLTYLAIPTDRMVTTGHTELKLIHQPRNKPYALLSWFYPDRVIGHEFLYGPRQEQRLSEESVIKVMAHSASSTSSNTQEASLHPAQQGAQAGS